MNPNHRSDIDYSDLKVSDGPFQRRPIGWSIQTSDGSELIFGTAVGLANSNFGWSSLGKPARLPAAVHSLARSAECRPAHHSFCPTACVRSWHSLALSYQRKPCLQPASNLFQPASNHVLARACTTPCARQPNKLQATHSAPLASLVRFHGGAAQRTARPLALRAASPVLHALLNATR
jgi:hypothetical protein